MARKRTKLELVARKASVENGLTEIMMGALLLLAAPMVEQPGVFTAFFAAFIVFSGRIREKLQEHFVYPRIGYFTVPEETPEQQRRLLIGMLVVTALIPVSTIMFWAIGGSEGFSVWMDYLLAPAVGIIAANGPIHLVREYGLRRAYAYAVLLPAVGVAVPLTGIAHGYASVAFTMMVVGVTSGLVGLIALRRFVRDHPAEEVSTDAVPLV